jgi:hypothetical protein
MRRFNLAVLIVTGIGVATGCTQSAAPAPSVVAGSLPPGTATAAATLLTGRTNSFAVLANPSKSAASASSVPFHIQHPVDFPLQQFGPRVIVFPPRNEPNVFFGDLQAVYRDQLHRSQTATSYVDPEGENVWLTEYFRFSLNGCSHDQAVQRTLLEISTGGQQPTCGAETPTFPSRELPNLFQAQLEAAYRDVLRRSELRSYVDTEGANVWLAEYLRYRVSEAGCDHATAENKVFTQIQGGGVQPVCGSAPPPPPPPPQPVFADFSVTPNDLSVAKLGQCITESVSSPSLHNVLRCTFDGRISTPTAGIISYEWNFFSGVATFTGATIQNVSVPCGSVGGAGSTERTVTLTVRTSSGSSTNPKSVTFVKPTFC